jgi:hypothetical protein
MAAKDWGTPPWKIAGGDKLDWFYRWQFFTSQMQAKEARDLARIRNGG